MPTSKVGSKKRSGPTLHETHLLREILRTHQVIMAAFLENLGMPPSRVVLMRLVAKANDHVGPVELARALGAKTSMVMRQLGEMQEEGLIRRRADPDDKRRHFVQLSAKGQRVFRGIHERSRALEQALTSKLGATETKVAAEVLSKLRTIAAPKARPKGRSKHG